jgi:hypothetical protein
MERFHCSLAPPGKVPVINLSVPWVFRAHEGGDQYSGADGAGQFTDLATPCPPSQSTLRSPFHLFDYSTLESLWKDCFSSRALNLSNSVQVEEFNVTFP